jgi:phosphatidylserine/phosphatidylglycerophosphate/cardiolipin synthase-like enzyme
VPTFAPLSRRTSAAAPGAPYPYPMAPALCYLLAGPDYLRAMADMISRASHALDLTMYLAAVPRPRPPAPPPAPWLQLLEAPNRGVRCRALLPATPRPSDRAMWTAAAADRLATAGWTVRRAHHAHPLHAKMLIADGAEVLLGSHNLTHTAQTRNSEASCLIQSRPYATHAARLFSAWWARAE